MGGLGWLDLGMVRYLGGKTEQFGPGRPASTSLEDLLKKADSQTPPKSPESCSL